MKKMLLVFSILILSCSMSFAETWKNIDSNTRGITTLEINESETSVKVHVWGSCTPKDCDWGVVKALSYASKVSSDLHRTAKTLIAQFKTSFKETLLVIKPLQGKMLQVEIYTDYTRDNRTDYYTVYQFKSVGFDESCKAIFTNNCGKRVCTTLRLPDFTGKGLLRKKLKCDGKCVRNFEDILLRNNISYTLPSAGASAKYPQCIGFRTDLGGTYKGAKCLASLLGEGFRVGNCNADGFPYNIYLF